jgi:predicted nucleotidyltransferase component of viral defense system
MAFMGLKTILSKKQKELLLEISANRDICWNFYLTGGTALAEFYLHHRLSEDLDFFSETEVDSQSIFVFLKSIGKRVGIKKIDNQQSFNRNLFFLHLKDGEIIKTEFTFFPFPRIEKTKKVGRLFVDSLLDIAVNKIFTIYQNPRSRDFIDLYFISKKEKFTTAELVKKAKIKFDWHVDLLQLGAQFLKAETIKDYPRMIKKVDNKKWQKFFVDEAKKLGREILE